MTQTPSPESFQIKWRGDILTVTLKLDAPRKGRAAFRTNIGHARIRRREIIDETEKGETPLARAWADIPLFEKEPGTFSADIPLNEIGIFSGKACFFPEGSNVPEWPEGANAHIKVESSETRKNNSKIRTYNYPQGRITDHRINYTIYNLSAFMDGEIQDCLDHLIVAENAERLKASEL